MTARNKVTAIVLAAGFSQRMTRFKPLLPLGDGTVVARVVKTYRDAGIADVVVVVGHCAAQMRQAVNALAVRCVENADYGRGMFTSVQAGIRALPPDGEAFFVHPVDIPLVRTQTIGRLLRAMRGGAHTVVYPAFDGRRGHPPLIDAGLAPRILQWPGTGGLRGFLQGHDGQSFDLAVADEAVLMDMDTPQDYERLRERLPRRELPSAAECRQLMERIVMLPAAIRTHCRMVAAVARQLALALTAAGTSLDVERIHAAALLHDIARLEKDHARAGARLLASHGFDALAPIVAAHMDLTVPADASVDEIQVVYLADKLVDGDRVVDPTLRFARKLEKYGDDPSAAAAIRRKRDAAVRIRTQVERITGIPLQRLIAAVDITAEEGR